MVAEEMGHGELLGSSIETEATAIKHERPNSKHQSRNRPKSRDAIHASIAFVELLRGFINTCASETRELGSLVLKNQGRLSTPRSGSKLDLRQLS
jgi:hypothetical protein